MSRTFETKALEYVKTCADPNDRTMILALAVGLDAAHNRITNLVNAAAKLSNDAEQIIKDAGR